jgi:hypothetical protein
VPRLSADREPFRLGAAGVVGQLRVAKARCQFNDVWLERVRPLADAEPHEFGKEGSFEALVRRFASD